ncbi:MAG: exo-alpha-sialidase [Paramuribaculum sp.]|nr:exo-alpha-sialidase [Paramuribaculum sp.]
MTLSNFTKMIVGIAVLTGSATQITAQQTHTEQWANGIERSLVYRPGDYDSKFYRIPAIVTAKDGSLVTVADKRIEHNGDLPAKIDVVSRRSTDGGKTWSDYVTVAAHDEVGGCGDPALVVDEKTGDILCIFSHGNGLWQDSPAQITVVRSKDNGKTWGPMLNINPQILTTDPNGKQPIKCTAAFASSGRALQLADGRIMFPLVTRTAGVNEFTVYAVYSDDGGKTWKVGKTPGTTDGDESKIVELADGTLIMSIRNRYRDKKYYNRRIFAYSKDRGETWSEPQPVYDILDPACNGDIIRYTYDGKDILLQSVPGSPNKRENVTIYASEDNGKTFPYKKVVCTTPSAYSSMTVMPDGRVGVLTEESQNGHQSYDIWFTAIPIEEIIKKEEKK